MHAVQAYAVQGPTTHINARACTYTAININIPLVLLSGEPWILSQDMEGLEQRARLSLFSSHKYLWVKHKLILLNENEGFLSFEYYFSSASYFYCKNMVSC